MANVQAGVNHFLGAPNMYHNAPSGAGGGSAGGSSSQSTSTQQSSGGTYFQNPDLVNSLAGSLANPIQNANANYMNFINNPAQHPIFQNALSGLLQALIPSEQLGQRNLMDMFRAAGNTSSSTFGDSARQFQADLIRNRQVTASNLLTSLFPQVANAMFAPMAQTSPLIDALKLSQQQSTSNSQSTSGPSLDAKASAGIISSQGSSGGSVYRPRR